MVTMMNMLVALQFATQMAFHNYAVLIACHPINLHSHVTICINPARHASPKASWMLCHSALMAHARSRVMRSAALTWH